MHFSKKPAKKSLVYLAGKLNLNFMNFKFKFNFPPSRLKIFLVGFVEKFAFNIGLTRPEDKETRKVDFKMANFIYKIGFDEFST